MKRGEVKVAIVLRGTETGIIERVGLGVRELR